MVNRSSNDFSNVFLDCNNNIRCGTKIIKKFGGVPYEGTVKEYDEENKLFKVRYEDGDSEEMTKEEVISHIKWKRR